MSKKTAAILLRVVAPGLYIPLFQKLFDISFLDWRGWAIIGAVGLYGVLVSYATRLEEQAQREEHSRPLSLGHWWPF